MMNDHHSQVSHEELGEVQRAHDQAVNAYNFLLKSLPQNGILDSIYSYKTRLKSIQSIIHKLNLKRKVETESYVLQDISDIIGMRLVTLFSDDIPNLLEDTLLLFKKGFEPLQSPFVVDSISEVTIYGNTQAPKDAERLNNLKNFAIRLVDNETKVTVVEKENLYSGIHLNAQVFTSSSSNMVVPIEIQVRSIFEEIWAEISHQINYKVRIEDSLDESISSIFTKKMYDLKTLLNLASENSVNLRNAASGLSSDTTEYESPPEFEDINEFFGPKELSALIDLEKLLSIYAVPEGIKKQLNKLIFEYRKIQLEHQSHSSNLNLANINLADKFSGLRREQEGFPYSKDFPSESQQACNYVLKMVEGYLRQFSNSDSQIVLAADIYASVIQNFPKCLVAEFRLAQVKFQISKFEACVSGLNTCLELFEKYENHEDEITPISKFERGTISYFKDNLHRYASFVNWKIAQNLLNETDEKDPNRVFLLLNSAYEIAKLGLSRVVEPEALIRLENNYIYFVADLLNFSRNTPTISSKPDIDLKSFSKLVKEFEENTTDSVRVKLSYLDTLLYVYKELGEVEKAKFFANRILDIIVEPGAKISDYSYSENYADEKIALILRRAIKASK